MPANAAPIVVIVAGTMLSTLLVSPVASQHLPPLGSLRDTSSLPVQRTQGWFQNLFGGRGSVWEGPRSKMPDENERNGDDIGRSRTPTGSYRTLCVRLCDGYYWPISHSAVRGRFSKDAKQCETACPSRSRLFVQRSGSEDVEGMVDLKGVPYTQLKHALRYRTEYVQDCTCRGNPWDAEAIARHRAYAEAAKSASEKPRADKKQSHDRGAKPQFGPSARAGLDVRE